MSQSGSSSPTSSTQPQTPSPGGQRVLVATTAMLAFISFWRAAAIVLNDMGSSAFYAGRDCGAFHRQDGSVVHPRHHGAGLCGAIGLHRELQHVCARRRLPRGQGGHGRRRWPSSRSRP